MKKNLFFISLFFVVILSGCNGCGGNNSPLQPTPTLTTITISPHLAEIVSGTVLSFIVMGYDQYGAEMSFTPVFIINPDELGTITPMQQSGVFTFYGKKKGKGKITVIGGNNIQTSANIEVITGELNSLVISPQGVTLCKDEILKFTIYGIDAEGNAKAKKFMEVSPVWSVVGDIGEINQDGTFRATRQGYGWVKAEVIESGLEISITATVEVKNRNPYIISGPTASPENIFVDETCNISILAKDMDEDILIYNWSKDMGIINGSGYSVSYTAPNTAGIYRISVEITDNYGGSITGIKDIIVNSASQDVWQKTYGGANGDYASSITQTQDGGYIVAGGTNSQGAGGYDVYVVKLNSSGNLEWERTYGGGGNEYASSIILTPDGGYILAGGTNSSGAGGYDVYVVKLNSSGNLEWERTYGGTNDDYASSIIQTDEGYVVTGGRDFIYTFDETIGGDIYILKLDGGGNKLWERTYGGEGNDDASSIQQTQDGGYIVGGGTNSFGAGGTCGEEPARPCYDFYIVKLDGQGDKVWEKTYGGSSSDYASSIAPTEDGGYIVGGGTNSFGSGSYDMYIIKLDSGGNKLWERFFGGTAAEKSSLVRQTTDNGYIIAGETFSFGAGENDMYVIKMNAQQNGGTPPKAKAMVNKTFSHPLPYQKFTPPFNLK